MTKPKPELSFYEKLSRLSRSGMSASPLVNRDSEAFDDLLPLNDRIGYVLGLANNNQRPAGNMLFFVMYDIESNKVRNYIAKYLLKKGCTRVQKSIFLSDLPMPTYNEIRNDLAMVQACYDNSDSILVVPISMDYLNAMKIIGQNVDFDVITKKKNTLFF